MVNQIKNGPVLEHQLLDGRYRIIEVIESSELGRTYLAKDTRRPTEPLCFVKHLRPANFDSKLIDAARRLFIKEAEALEKLGRHDQIPQLFAYFEENQEFYLVQGYVAGHPLDKEIMAGHPWAEEKVIGTIKQILEILEFVHNHNVIHRDIKPSNIVRRTADNKLVLIDFGAVKQISAVTQEGSPATVRVGTLEYMPIEQFEYNPQINSDIYAVGMIAIQLLTGLPPLELPKLRGEASGKIRGEIGWTHLAVVSDELAQIIDKMVSYDYRQRYQSTGEVLKDLETLVEYPQERREIFNTYLKEVQVCASHRGEITVVGRQILEVLRNNLEISPEEAEKLEDEVLNPYRKSREKGERYARAFKDAIQQEYPISKDTREELKKLKEMLMLTNEDVDFLEKQISPSSPIDKLSAMLFTFLRANSYKNNSELVNRSQTGNYHHHAPQVALATGSPRSSSLSGDALEKATLHKLNAFSNHRLIGNEKNISNLPNQPIVDQSNSSKSGKSGRKMMGTIAIASLGVSAVVLGLIGAIVGYQEWQKAEKKRLQEIQQISISNVLYQEKKYEECLPSLGKIASNSANYQVAQTLAHKCEEGIKWKEVRLQTLGQNQGEISAIAFSYDGFSLVSGSKNKKAQIWDVTTGQLKRSFDGDNSIVWSVAFNHNATQLATGTSDWRVMIWNLITGNVIRVVEHTATVWSVAFSPKSDVIASASGDRTVKVWDLETGELRYNLADHQGYVYSVAISADGKTLVSGSEDQSIKVWDLGTGNLIYNLTGHSGGVRTVAISADNKMIVSGSHDGTVKVWNLRTGELIKTFTGHTGSIVSVAISPDHKLIASGGKDRTVKIWDVLTGELLNTLNGHTDEVHTVAFSPDSRSVASSGKDKNILLWQR